MVSFIRSTSVLSFEVRKLVPVLPRSPGTVVCGGKRSCLVINCEGLGEEVGGSHSPRRIEDEEITLPIPLNFVSDHRPRMSCVLEHHWHASRHSYSPIQHVVDGPDTFETWREVGCDPSHYLPSSTVCPEVKDGVVRITKVSYLFYRCGSLPDHI